jgi:hypothetical protein
MRLLLDGIYQKSQNQSNNLTTYVTSKFYKRK